MKADLTGRVALVFGATRGIGRAIALKYAECGAQVAFQGRDAAAAEEVRSAVAGVGGLSPVFIPSEVSGYEEAEGVIRRTVQEFGQLDILVANGGSHHPRPELFHQIPPENLPAYFGSRLFNRIYMIHAAFLLMKERRYGKIVTITTDAGRVPTPSEAVNGAAAAALIFMTRALGREFARWGVRINTISTTLTRGTPPYETYRQRLSTDPDAVIVKAFRKIEERAPFGLNEPADLAELALYLAAPESDQLSGATISVNGGISFPSY